MTSLLTPFFFFASLFQKYRFHPAEVLYVIDHRLKTLKFSENIRDTLGCDSCVTFWFLPQVYVICDLN